MASLPTRSFTTVVQTIAAGIQGRAAALIDFTTGSPLRAIAEAYAGATLWLQTMALQILATTRLATSSGTDIDSFLADFGLTRTPAGTATGYVLFARFTAGSSAPFIPVGAKVQSSDGSQNYLVIADATNPAYSANLGGFTLAASLPSILLPVQAVTPGPAANAQAGQVSVLTTPIVGIDYVTNPSAFSGGSAAMTDAQAQALFVGFIASLSKSTVAAIQYCISSFEIGMTSTIIENVDYSGNPHQGYLLITVDDGSGYPPQSLLNSVAAVVANFRAAGVLWGVFAPLANPVSIAVSLTTDPSYNHQTLVAQVAIAVGNYMATVKLGQSLSYSKLYQIVYNVSPGVTDAILTINGATADITATPQNRILLGAMTVV